MVKKYCCEICQKYSDQKSHHTAHLKSNDHKMKVKLFIAENLKPYELNDLLEKYHQYKNKFDNKELLIKQIIKDMSTVVMNTQNNEPEPEVECKKYKPSNKVVWELSENVDENENYKKIKSSLESLIKQCHNILYSSSIVGQKAQDITDNNFKKYKIFCKDLTELYKSNKGILTEWKGFVNKFLIYLFPSIYYEDDNKFNCIDEGTLKQLIDKIESIKIDDEFVDSFSTTCGDIHESFRSYGGGKGAKELGQYFTPRQLIHLIFHGSNLNQYLDNIENPSIYDPCMGTGGFLTRLFNLGNINPLKETYEKTFPDSTVKFKEIYPLEVNNGACLFVQHCVYMLNDGGVCAIVLPDGELFEGNSKWSKNYRKWLCENVNIHTILKCPSGTFDHATVTTNVVVFTKTGPTQNIRYIKTTKECEKINELITITKDDLEKTQYSLEVEDYIEENIEEIKIPYMKLGDICELEKGEIQSSKRVDGKYKLVSQSNSRTHNEYKYDGKNVFVSCVARVGEIYYYDGKCHATTLLYNLKIKQDININPKYLYLVLKDNPKTYACEKGSSNKSLNQNRFMNIKIPFPDIHQQNEIVDHLNFVEIENRIIQMEKEKMQFVKYSRLPEIKKLLSNAKKLLITELVEFEKGKVQSTKADYDENGSYKFITKSESHKWQNINTYKYDGYNVFIANTCNGNGSIPIRKYEGKCDCSTLMSVIKPKINIDIKFIYYTLIHMNKEIEEKFTKGNGCYAGKLNIDKLKIPLPSPEIQEQCIQIYQEKEQFIQSIDDKIEAEKKYIEELKQLSKDIIHNYC